MIYHIGYRRFRAAAIFSQHTNADKHKVWNSKHWIINKLGRWNSILVSEHQVERFMPDSGPFVATVFAPILYNPASVLVFKERTNGEHSLLATG